MALLQSMCNLLGIDIYFKVVLLYYYEQAMKSMVNNYKGKEVQ